MEQAAQIFCLGRTLLKDIRWIGCSIHCLVIGKVAILSRSQLFIEAIAENLFMAGKNDAIAGPVVGIEMGHLKFEQMSYQCILLLIKHSRILEIRKDRERTIRGACTN